MAIELFQGETISGWGVVRDRPWHFEGVYKTEAESRRVAAALGPAYAVRFGQNLKGTAFFKVFDDAQANAMSADA